MNKKGYLTRLVSFLKDQYTLLILGSILSSSFLINLKNLGHKSITLYDELFHALVAKNLLKHFFKFTLYDQPFLAYNFKHWGQNHIWLHKPPLAMWQIAISYYILGVNTFALRLPSAILAIGACFFTYLIGKELFNKHVAVIASFLQAFNPFILELVHGYRFSDHIDIALLFWVEISCYLLIKAIKTNQNRYYFLSGTFSGLAYLAKSFLGFVTIGIAIVFWVLTTLDWSKDYNIGIKKIIIHIGSSLIVISPWVIYCLILYPREYLYETKMVLAHLNTNIEGWQASWDRHLFDYMSLIYPIIYVGILVSFVYIIILAFRKRDLGNSFILVWALGALIPLFSASSKTPSATIMASPALFLCFALITEKAFNKKHHNITLIYSVLLTSVFLFSRDLKDEDIFRRSVISISIKFTDWVKPVIPFIKTRMWITVQLFGFIILIGIICLIYLFVRKFLHEKWLLRFLIGLRAISLILICVFAFLYIKQTLLVTQREQGEAKWASFGKQIKKNLQKNSVLLWENCPNNAYLHLMFYSDRAVYTLQEPLGAFAQEARPGNPQGKSLEQLIQEAQKNGGKPYLITSGEKLDYPCVLKASPPLIYKVFALSGH